MHRTATTALIAALLAWDGAAQAQERLDVQGVKSPLRYQQSAPFDLRSGLETVGDWTAVVTAALDPEREIDARAARSRSRICFVRSAPAASRCTDFAQLFHSSLPVQTLEGLSVVVLRTGAPQIRALELRAEALYQTGQFHETALWVYDRKRDAFRLAGAFRSDELEILADGALSGCIVTADADVRTDQGETRFGSDHRRIIALYRYSASDHSGAGTYRKVLSYTTARKYGAEDTQTIGAELPDIQSRYARSH